MRFAILGPLEVLRDGEPVALPGAKQRALLAALLIHAGEVVSTDRLAEILWGDDQPANPRNALQSQVSQLRKLLGPQGRELIASRPTGYTLAAPAEAIDANWVEARIREGRRALAAGEVAEAAAVLREALERWRGPVLAEFAGQPFADATIARLEELRLGALEERVEAELAGGRHAELVAELESLSAAHPLRERLQGQLMLALYRCGRQADALNVFHATRQVLDEELGLDPSPELTRRYEDLLRHDDPGAAVTPPNVVADTSAADPPVIASGDDRDDADPVVAGGVHLRSSPPRPALSSFVGREDELARVIGLLRGARLVTLSGPGGVGKTRLAAEAASALDGDPMTADGIWFVELAAVRDGDLLFAEVAAALGLPDDGAAAAQGLGGTRAVADRVADALRHRRALLVLDNCEHLVDAAAEVARDLLTAAPDLKVLCTTREALGVTGETVWSVPSLTVPPGTIGMVEELTRWGAALLFVERVRSSDPAFELSDADAPVVADICRRLDGIPLALELAASRVRTLGLQELASRLDDRFRILTSGDRTAQARQRTLRAVVEWSWDLLDERERALFRRLSVFTAGATLDAVESVCAGDEVLATDGVLEVLAGLVDKSVVILDRSEHPVRYRMLETLRAFGQQQLEAAQEETRLRDRHADRMLEVVRDLVPRLRGEEQVDVMRVVDAAHADLRAALSWLATTGEVAQGARLAAALGWYWYLRGRRDEAVRWLSTFDEAPDVYEAAMVRLWRGFLSLGFAATEPLREAMERAAASILDHGDDDAIALSQLMTADLAAVLGHTDAQAEHLARAREAAARLGDEGYAATADFVVGHGYMAAGRYLDAEPWMLAACERFATVGDRWGQTQCLMSLVGVAEANGDLETATARCSRALELAQELGLREMEGVLHARLAMFEGVGGSFDNAWDAIARVRAISDDLGSPLIAANAELAEGVVAARAGDLDRSEQALRSLLDRLHELPHSGVRAETFARLGSIAAARRDLDGARALHGQAIEVALVSAEPQTVAFCLEAAAATLAAGGDTVDAAILLGAARERRRSVGLPLPAVERDDVERAERLARDQLGDVAFDDAFSAGASTPDADLPLRRPGIGPVDAGDVTGPG